MADAMDVIAAEWLGGAICFVGVATTGLVLPRI